MNPPVSLIAITIGVAVRGRFAASRREQMAVTRLRLFVPLRPPAIPRAACYHRARRGAWIAVLHLPLATARFLHVSRTITFVALTVLNRKDDDSYARAS